VEVLLQGKLMWEANARCGQGFRVRGRPREFSSYAKVCQRAGSITEPVEEDKMMDR